MTERRSKTWIYEDIWWNSGSTKVIAPNSFAHACRRLWSHQSIFFSTETSEVNFWAKIVQVNNFDIVNRDSRDGTAIDRLQEKSNPQVWSATAPG